MIPNDARLDVFARLAVDVGVNLQPGQKLIVSADLEAAPVVRAVAARAYDRGARLVETLWRDDALTLLRHRRAPEGSFDAVPRGYVEAFNHAIEDDVAAIYLNSTNPDLLAEQDPQQVAQARRALSAALEPYQNARGEQRINWCIVGVPSVPWARKTFPDRPDDDAVAALWDAILRTMRADRDDPVAAWETHLATLERALEHLNDRRYDALRLRAPDTDLTIGLPRGHRWLSARFERRGGVSYVANLPTEEVFTSPDAARVDGTVQATKPLAHSGTLIEGFGMRFEGGRVVEHWADAGDATLTGILESDEGARRLGEVALVPHGSPISQSGLLFYNTLFDENAANHIALGRGFPFALDGEPNAEAAAERGVNRSVTHVDFMIGSGAMDVDGVTEAGDAEPLMRSGEWAFPDA